MLFRRIVRARSKLDVFLIPGDDLWLIEIRSCYGVALDLHLSTTHHMKYLVPDFEILKTFHDRMKHGMVLPLWGNCESI